MSGWTGTFEADANDVRERNPSVGGIMFAMYFLRGFTTMTLAACVSAAATLGCAKTSEFGDGGAGSPAAQASNENTGGGVGTGGAPGGTDSSTATGSTSQTNLDGAGSSTSSGGSTSDGPDSSCGDGYLSCSGTCIQESDMNCGSCGKVCPANANCVDSQCVCDGGGQVACEDACIDVLSNNDHCGRCETACGALGQCVEGACSCLEGAGNCEGTCVDLGTTAEHCGDCTIACGENQACVGAACVCAPGTEDCGAGCTDVMSDEANCGACGTPCDSGLQCFEGACQTYTCFPFEELSTTQPGIQNVGTTDGACYRVELGSVSGGNCWNFDGREMLINGASVECEENVGPQTALEDGFIYVEVTAGDKVFAGFGLWL